MTTSDTSPHHPAEPETTAHDRRRRHGIAATDVIGRLASAAGGKVMCGIAGLWRAERSGLTADATAMARALAHRGPDDRGVWTDVDSGVALAQARLSVIDVTATGHQPMTTPDGRFTLVFNGEVYDHVEQRERLRASGARFRGTSDTEVLLEAISRWGVQRALESTTAMFAIAVWDAHERCLVLARDRFGEKPLYWWNSGGSTAFASELRALAALDWFRPEIDDRSACALLRHSFVPHPHTIWRGVRQVPPGGCVTIRADEPPRERRWWSLSDAIGSARRERRDIGLDAAADEVDEAIGRSVGQRLRSDVPLGAFLSGGIDSSLVVSHAQRLLGDLRTFTISMPDAGLDESAHARRVAEHLGTNHTTIPITTADALDLVPRLARIYDEPFADPSMLPTALLSSVVRRHVTVALSGDGGDEMFAGYNRHGAAAALQRRLRSVPAPVRRAAARGALRVPPRFVDRVAAFVPRTPPAAGDKVHKAARLAIDLDDPWDTLSSTWPREMTGLAHTPAAVTAALHADLDPVERLVAADTASVLPDDMLTKVDRASMAVALEVRVPLVDHDILALAWSLPTSLKAHQGTGKRVLRHVAARHLPEDLSTRPKLGFDPPIETWLRNELRPWADDLLQAPRCVDAGWLDGDGLRASWADHLAGRRNESYRLWAVLMLESWLTER